jgi:hypothetical protein
MAKTTNRPAPKKSASKTPAGKLVVKVAPAASRPRRRKGPVLEVQPIELPRVPLHDYGQHRHVGALEAGDLLYVGDRQHLSLVEVHAIEPDKASGGSCVLVHVLAVDLEIDGVRYSGNEQVTLLADANSRIAAKSL